MKSFLVCLSSVALMLSLSSTALANVQFEQLSCGVLTRNGEKVLGMSYRLEVIHGFDTHLTGPNGERGQKFEIFNLYSKPVAPRAKESKTKLSVESENKVKVFLSSSEFKITMNKDYSKASLVSISDKSQTICTNPKNSSK